jgi:hypothetical protein
MDLHYVSVFWFLGNGNIFDKSKVEIYSSFELYATQLAQLQETGFFDRWKNVHAAVERLLVATS